MTFRMSAATFELNVAMFYLAPRIGGLPVLFDLLLSSLLAAFRLLQPKVKLSFQKQEAHQLVGPSEASRLSTWKYLQTFCVSLLASNRVITPFVGWIIFTHFHTLSITLCSRPQAANDLISGIFMKHIVPDNAVKCFDLGSNCPPGRWSIRYNDGRRDLSRKAETPFWRFAWIS